MINFFSEDISFKLHSEKNSRVWINRILRQEDFEAGEINFIFCSDIFLYDINVLYLQHETLTDIITFDQSDDNSIEGDIYISIDRVKDNAVSLDVSFKKELHRVMIHGILHLLGYTDKTPKEKQLMREKEDECLSLHNDIF